MIMEHPSGFKAGEPSCPDDAHQAGAQVKLADFGIAKLFGAASQTAHGSIVGTAEFMPEQAAGKPLDARADL